MFDSIINDAASLNRYTFSRKKMVLAFENSRAHDLPIQVYIPLFVMDASNRCIRNGI